MLFKKFALIAGLVIIPGCVTLLVALKSAGFAPGTGSFANGFAELSVDAAYSDRAVGEALSAAGITDYISESSSWVFLDDFGELKRVALDLYDEMVEPFDPRNDGYAEKLRSFFVKDGKRRFFIDLRPSGKALSGAPLANGQLEGRIAAALGEGMAFTLDGFSAIQSRPRFWLLLLSLTASGGALFFALRNPGAFPREFSRLAATLIPVQGALALSGPGGFACAAALFGCFECLLPPIRENLLRVQLRRRRFRFDRIFRINWFLALFFFLVYVLAAAASRMDPLTAVLAGISAFAAFGFFLRLESSESNPERGYIHRRFLPIPIRAPSFSLNSLPRMTLPFALASFFSLFLPLFGPSGRSPDIFPAVFPRGDSPLSAMPDIPSREEYEAHFAFQSSFSMRPLGSRDQAGDAAYLAYYLGEDGLIAGSRETTGLVWPDYPEIPPFPLEELGVFLENRGNYTARGTGTGDIFAALVILLLALPSCFRRVREKRKIGTFLILNDKGDKQAAA
ncbi:MAG: hypothetical protein LBC31_00045 [Treponema sp.]|jgi:hypothetical protein|nr:hypothetical protein [Treponema sp.]